MATLQDLKSKSQDELIAMLLAEQENAKRKLTLKVSKQGAVSLYGMGKWPVTLYADQWERVIDMVPTIRAFITANKASLSVKKA